jgi:hypothetical protein
MTKTAIMTLQKRIGTAPDGFWGPKSITACQKHLRALMPAVNSWPRSDIASLVKFYGPAGDEDRHVLIALPFTVNLYGNDAAPRGELLSHERCAESLRRVFLDLQRRHAGDEPVMTAARSYFGVYNNRNKQGGTTKSLHAFAAAIDLDATDNRFKQSWPLSASMPIEVMECFAREGWLAAGAFWGYDAMHFQATR